MAQPLLAALEQAAARCLLRRGRGAAWSRAFHCLDPARLDQFALPGVLVAKQIAFVLKRAVGPTQAQALRTPTVLAGLRAVLRERFYEGDLSPLAVAEHHGISRRRRRFQVAGQGTTFVAKWMAIRLEHVRRILKDARFAQLPIGGIAAAVSPMQAALRATCVNASVRLRPRIAACRIRWREHRIDSPESP